MELTTNTRAFIYASCMSMGAMLSFIGISLLTQGIFGIEYKAIFVGLGFLSVGLFLVFYTFFSSEARR